MRSVRSSVAAAGLAGSVLILSGCAASQATPGSPAESPATSAPSAPFPSMSTGPAEPRLPAPSKSLSPLGSALGCEPTGRAVQNEWVGKTPELAVEELLAHGTGLSVRQYTERGASLIYLLYRDNIGKGIVTVDRKGPGWVASVTLVCGNSRPGAGQ